MDNMKYAVRAQTVLWWRSISLDVARLSGKCSILLQGSSWESTRSCPWVRWLRHSLVIWHLRVWVPTSWGKKWAVCLNLSWLICLLCKLASQHCGLSSLQPSWRARMILGHRRKEFPGQMQDHYLVGVTYKVKAWNRSQPTQPCQDSGVSGDLWSRTHEPVDL